MASSMTGGGDGGKGLPEQYRTGIAALDYPRRKVQAKRKWQKSIIRTKNVILNSFHIPGSCLPQGKPPSSDINTTDAIPMFPKDGGCAFYVYDVQMVHMRGIQSGMSEKLEGNTVVNDLQSLLASDRR